jgi:hypothetical protein
MNAEKLRAEVARLLTLLSEREGVRLVPRTEDCELIGGEPGRRLPKVKASVFRALLSAGLIHEAEPGAFAASEGAAAWLKRQRASDMPFRMQHGEVEAARGLPDAGRDALLDLDESPVATLARKKDRTGAVWLPAHLVSAAERLRRDFEVGQLRPRVTANWSAAVNRGRRTGDGSGTANLTDIALEARMRFDRAMREVGQELAGILVDVCCFLKGLETVERERQWPARSAKLVLRIALAALARHYGLEEAAEGRAESRRTRTWGAEDYRPEIM